MNTIKLLYANINQVADQKKFQLLFNELPKTLQSKNEKYLRYKDRCSNLLGKLLLKRGFFEMTNEECLPELSYNNYKKPFINNSDIHFNISHSGEYVICGFIRGDIMLGVDIEKKKPLNYESLLSSFNSEFRQKIENSKNPLETFYDIWVKREAIIKANGKGFYADYKSMSNIDNNVILLENESYFLKEINIDNDYKTHIASNIFVEEINCSGVKF